jgi:hypothetical protein
MKQTNRDSILDQFTRWAAHFARSPVVHAETLLDRMVKLSESCPAALASGGRGDVRTLSIRKDRNETNQSR